MTIEKTFISDMDSYNEGMRKSLLDKSFFMDKIFDVNSFLDYGCADGSLIHFLSSLFPEYEYLGYDIDNSMIELARERNPEKLISNQIPSRNQSRCLILSSIIHEVCSYCSVYEIDSFWSNVFELGFKNIVIRDMIPSSTINRESFHGDVQRLIKNADNKLLKDFEMNWGSISLNKNMIHFLLKYKYTENWSREVKENYMPIDLEKLYTIIPSTYEIVYFEHYIHPFIRQQVMNDFSIELKDNTHCKMILQRK